MKKCALSSLVLLALVFSSCVPKTHSRDESLAVSVLSALREHETKDERPYLITLKSVSGNLDLEARRRVFANIKGRGFKFVDALVVDPKGESMWGRELKRYRSLVTFEIVTWVSDHEVIIKSSNTPDALAGSGGTYRMKKRNGVWEVTETIEKWVS